MGANPKCLSFEPIRAMFLEVVKSTLHSDNYIYLFIVSYSIQQFL